MTDDDRPTIPDLLHDACLLSGAYDAEESKLRLEYECLRRQTDGSAMEDRTVTLHLDGVTAVITAYDSIWPEDRPSAFRLPEDARLAALAPWPLPAMEIELSIDSATSAESLALAAHRESLVQTSGADGAHLVCLHLSRGTPRAQVLLAVRCETVRPYADGQPLALEDWAEEFAAWWKGWEDHWSSQDEPTDDPDLVDEDAHIPAASDDALDTSYVPPRQPAFECVPTEAPEELVSPLRTWFEAGLALDAEKRVSVAPNLDEHRDDQIASEHAWMTGDDDGSWDYAREVEAWWIEGDRAYVGIAGVTHYMPMDGDPAEDQLSRWSFALRQREGIWQSTPTRARPTTSWRRGPGRDAGVSGEHARRRSRPSKPRERLQDSTGG